MSFTPSHGTTTQLPQRPEPLVRVNGLKKYFPIQKGLLGRTVGQVKAVDDVSFDIFPGETLGMVGESGCGKTTIGRTLLRLVEPTSGSALFKGRDLFQLSPSELRAERRNMQIVFQDPYSSLNPRMTIESIVGEAMRIHGVATAATVREEVMGLLEKVGLQRSYVSRYPHEFSGGQRQRIGIARAISLKPEFIVCDEAVSALDVSVQAQVINLLLDLQDEFKLSYLFIAHDLSVVRHISNRIAVMYLGQLVELAETDELFKHPAHPYTQALLSAIPEPDTTQRRERILLKGMCRAPSTRPQAAGFIPAALRPTADAGPRLPRSPRWAQATLSLATSTRRPLGRGSSSASLSRRSHRRFEAAPRRLRPGANGPNWLNEQPLHDRS